MADRESKTAIRILDLVEKMLSDPELRVVSVMGGSSSSSSGDGGCSSSSSGSALTNLLGGLPRELLPVEGAVKPPVR